MEVSPERGVSHSSGHKEAGIKVSAAFGIVNALCVKGLVPTLWYYWKTVKLLRGGTQLEGVKSLGACLYCLSSLRYVLLFRLE